MTASPSSPGAPRGPGLFEIAPSSGGERAVTNVRRLAGRDRAPGSSLVLAAAVLLGLLAAGLFVVSLAAQYRYVFAVKHQPVPSAIEAIGLDVGMTVFSLLALGLAMAGQTARIERVLIVVCAAASAAQNYAAADIHSPRSIAAYLMPPLFLALVVDRVIAVVRRHVLGDAERSVWATAGHGITGILGGLGVAGLYLARLILAPPSTAAGVRRLILHAAPLPPVPARTPDPYVREPARTGPWPAPAPDVDRDAVITRLAEEIRDAIEAGDRWQPDYPALMADTGRRRSWCEKAVRDARTTVFDTPRPDPGPGPGEHAEGALR